MKSFLLTPGPTPVPEKVLLAIAQPIIHHRTKEFGKLLEQVTEQLKNVFQTKNDVLTFTSSGTGSMEACVVNTLSPGDKAVVLDTGNFGTRWTKLIKTYGLEPVVVKYSWGQAVRPEDLKRTLEAESATKVVFCQLTETSTGVVNDVRALAKIAHEVNAILVVDAISGLAGQRFYQDEWDIDIVCAGSQKGLMLPPGLAFVSVNERGWQCVNSSTLPKFYWDFNTYRKSLREKKQTPYTPAVTLLAGAEVALNMLIAEGMEHVFSRVELLARATRAGIKAAGLELFAERPCDVVTAVRVPSNLDGADLLKRMQDKYGVMIAGGQADYKGKIFRIAHMGYMDKFDVIVALAGLEIVLSEMGYNIKLGNSVAAAQEVFLGKNTGV
jgi:aspartate aminotransferase-like enzyme